VNGISGLAEGGYGPLVNTGKHDAFKSYYTRFNTFSLLPVSFFYKRLGLVSGLFILFPVIVPLLVYD
jgi:hypothetical protein